MNTPGLVVIKKLFDDFDVALHPSMIQFKISTLCLLVIEKKLFEYFNTFDPCDLESGLRSFINKHLVAHHASMLQAKYQYPWPYSY